MQFPLEVDHLSIHKSLAAKKYQRVLFRRSQALFLKIHYCYYYQENNAVCKVLNEDFLYKEGIFFWKIEKQLFIVLKKVPKIQVPAFISNSLSLERHNHQVCLYHQGKLIQSRKQFQQQCRLVLQQVE